MDVTMNAKSMEACIKAMPYKVMPESVCASHFFVLDEYHDGKLSGQRTKTAKMNWAMTEGTGLL